MRIQTYLTAPSPIASEVMSSSSSVQSAILPEQNHRRVMCSHRKIFFKKKAKKGQNQVPFSVRRLVSSSLHRDLASSSWSTSRTTSEQRVRKRLPSNPRTRPKPTCVVFGYFFSFRSGSQPAMLAAYNKFHQKCRQIEIPQMVFIV